MIMKYDLFFLCSYWSPGIVSVGIDIYLSLVLFFPDLIHESLSVGGKKYLNIDNFNKY